MSWIILILVGSILFLDWALLPHRSRNSLKLLFLASVLGAVALIFHGNFALQSELSKWGLELTLHEIVFFLGFLLLRDLLISRSRQYFLEEQLQQLVRENALEKAIKLTKS